MGILLASQPTVLAAAGVTAGGIANLTWMGFIGNLVPVTIGNIIDGSILVGAVYWLAYLRRERIEELATARPWVKVVIPSLRRTKLKEPAQPQLDEVVRTHLNKPAALNIAGKTLLAVLSRARDDCSFLARLAENPAQALEGYELTPEEKVALSSGDTRWIESKPGSLDEPLRTWLTARLTQEKW